MARRIRIIHRIIIAIAIQVQAIDGFGAEICSIIGRDESSPLRRIIPGIAVIQAGVVIVIVATVSDRIGVGHIVAGSLAGNGAVAPGVVQILSLQRAVGVTCILPFFQPAVKKKPPRP